MMAHLEMPLEGRRDHSPSNNGTNQLIANLDHELLDVRVRAVKCLLRKLQVGIITGESLKYRVDLLDRCKRWLLRVQSTSPTAQGDSQLSPEEQEGVDQVIQLLAVLAQQKDFLDLLRSESVDSLLLKLKPFCNSSSSNSKCQLDALLNSILCGQYELNYKGSPSEWFDNKTSCPPLSSRLANMYSSRPYNKYSYESDYRSPSRGREDSTSPRNTPESTVPKKSTGALAPEEGWAEKLPFFVPHVQLQGTDKRLIHSTLDNLSGQNEGHVLMTVTFIRDTLSNDFPPEYFIQEPSIILGLAQIPVNRWVDSSIPHLAIQTLLKMSQNLRFRLCQLNTSELYEVPQSNPDQISKWPSSSYDYDPYSSRMTPKSQAPPSPTDSLIENFCQLFKNFARSLTYTSYELHIWPIFDSWAFTLLKCVKIYSVEAKQLTLSIQGILMELSHVWDRKNDYFTTLGLALVSISLLSCMKHYNETFIVSKDVRNMLRNISASSSLRQGWPEISQEFYKFSEMFDPSGGIALTSDKPSGEEDDNHPRKKILKTLYTIQNASSHEEVISSLDTLEDILSPISLNSRLGGDVLTYLLVEGPWRDTFYRFLCIEPTTEGDEHLLSRCLDVFSFILNNIYDPSMLKWISPLCCEKGCTTMKIFGGIAIKKEVTFAGAALSNLTLSLLTFYEAIWTHDKLLLKEETKWELFQHCLSILHSLEESSYQNSALLGGISKILAKISGHEFIQDKMKTSPTLCVGLIHRITDIIIVLEANGSMSGGYKNSWGVYYLGVCLVHGLVAILKDDNYKRFKGDWVERCGRVFNVFEMISDSRIKCQAFQIAGLLTSVTATKTTFCESSFQNSMISLLDISYRAFIDRKYPASIKFRAGNVLLNILNDDDDRARYTFTKRLHQDRTFLIELGRMASRLMWSAQISAAIGDRASNKNSDGLSGGNDATFITPKVLTVLCKILTTFIHTLLEANEREGLLQEVMTSGIGQILFRIVLKNPLASETNDVVWLTSCSALSSLFDCLINLLQLDRSLSIILIGEKRCLSVSLGLLELSNPPGEDLTMSPDVYDQALNTLGTNILNMATILTVDAGNNFEDLERIAWAYQPILFKKLSSWLKMTTPLPSRRAAISFTHAFFSVLSLQSKNSSDSSKDNLHPFLCRAWIDDYSYGQVICDDLIAILKSSVDLSERLSSLKCLSSLFTLSGSSVKHAVETSDLINFIIFKLKSSGAKFFESKSTSLHGSKKATNLQTETLALMDLLSCTFYVNAPSKRLALRANFADILHKIFAWWRDTPDHSLLHTYIETLLNFTEEFPEGALSLTMTSNVVGVGPRRVPTPQSLFMEILGILEKELAGVEGNPSLKTVEVLFELQKNISFVQECRNILLKSPVILFLRKLHTQETKKWGLKQNTVKINYLDFLVHVTAHQDVQTCIAKIPEGLDILVQLVETEPPPGSTLALKILRNLCFQSLNRGRLLSENLLIPVISNKLVHSSNLEEIETAAISLWALIANYEKGRLFAKKSYCAESLSKALETVRKVEQTSAGSNQDSEQALSRLISLLQTVQNVLGGTTGGPRVNQQQVGSKSFLHSRPSTSSLSQL